MGTRLVNRLYFLFFGLMVVALGCFGSRKASDRSRRDAGTGWGDVSDVGVADVNDRSDTGGIDEDSGRRDSGRRDSGRRDSGRRDSGENVCDSEELDSWVPMTIAGNTRGAPNRLEPSCADRGAPERTFIFQPAIEGRYQIDTFGSDFDTVLYVLGGDCRGTERFCNDDDDASVQSYLDIWLNAGETVTLVVDGFTSSDQGRFVLTITGRDPQCGNGIIDRGEECDGRTIGGTTCSSLGFDGGRLLCDPNCLYDVSMCVVGGTGGIGGSGGTGGTGGSGGHGCDSIGIGSTVPQSVSGNTYSRPDRLEPSCAEAGSGEQSYLFQAGRSGYYTFDTFESDFDTVLYLLDGDCTAMELDCDDDSGGVHNGLQSRVTVFLRAQQLTTVVVDGYGGEEGDFVLNIRYHGDESVCGNGVIEPGEQCDLGNFDGSSCASYGYQYGDLDCNPVDCTIGLSDCYNLPSGGTAAGSGSAGDGGSGGSGSDSCDSIDLGSTIPQSISGNTLDSPDNLNSTCVADDGPEQSFVFTASQTRTYVFDTVGSDFDTVLYVRRGDCYGYEIACNDDSEGLQSRISLSLQAGETVTIVVDGFSSSEGFFVLNVNRYEEQVACGNGVIRNCEKCDANNLASASCRSLGYRSGPLFCILTNWLFDVSIRSDSSIVDGGLYRV